MHRPAVLRGLVLMILLPFGCGQASSPAVAPALNPPASDPVARGVDDATEILKAINKNLKSGGPATEGVNQSVTQVGSHRLKSVMDVSVSSSIQDDKAVVSFGGRTLDIEFDKGYALLDHTEKSKLPVGTKEIEIRFVGGKLSVMADGAELFRPGAPK
jgi:hypothetical protein